MKYLSAFSHATIYACPTYLYSHIDSSFSSPILCSNCCIFHCAILSLVCMQYYDVDTDNQKLGLLKNFAVPAVFVPALQIVNSDRMNCLPKYVVNGTIC